MGEKGIAVVVIPSGDPHQSEYTADHWQARHWLTGFTGSAGMAAVAGDRSALFVDGRYTLQAEQQIGSSVVADGNSRGAQCLDRK